MEDILGAGYRKSGCRARHGPQRPTSFPLSQRCYPARHWPQGTGVGAKDIAGKPAHEQPRDAWFSG